MTRYVSFLRAINVGNRRVAMSRLREIYEQLALDNVASFIASGNVLFDSQKKATELESLIEKKLEVELGYSVDTFVREFKDVQTIAAEKMFEQDGLPGHVIHVAFLRKRISPAIQRRWEGMKTELDEFRFSGTELYWLYQGRVSDSKFWSSKEFKSLVVPPMTMRNITSIRKLVAQFKKPSGD
jgi:uncharacterized protein (DUF1697 family)